MKASGDTELITLEQGKHFTLEELQAFVGGYVELVRTPAGRYLVLNEDGKQLGLPPNTRATAIARSAGIMPNDIVVGDVLWVTATELDGKED